MAIDSSKLTTYAAVAYNLLYNSKQTTYAALLTVQIDNSKQTTYAALYENQDQSSKLTTYAVMRAWTAETSSKLTTYAVLFGNPADNASKLTTYAVLEGWYDLLISSSKLTTYAVLQPKNIVLVPIVFGEPLTGGEPSNRAPLVSVEPLTGGEPNIRGSLVFSEPLTGGNPKVRLPLIFAEIIYAVPVEKPIVTALFPTLPGLAWSVHKKPNFNTRLSQHVSGREVRAAFWQYPRYDFELTYDWLPEKDGRTDLDTLMGFFMQRQGMFDEWLFKDVTDYLAAGAAQLPGDGVTVQFSVVRTLGGWQEPVGAVNQENMLSFPFGSVDVTSNAINVNAHGLVTGDGPFCVVPGGTIPGGLSTTQVYWAIRVDANNFKLANSKANALAGTAVDITTQGTLTNQLNRTIAIYHGGVLQSLSTFSLEQNNQIVYDVAPADDTVITADFQYYFICRFNDDMADFENFMDKLWQLQKCEFRSLIL